MKTFTTVTTLALPLVAVFFGTVGCSGDDGAAAGKPDGSALDATVARVGPDGGAVAPLDCGDAGTDWPMYGQNICNTRGPQGAGAISAQSAPSLAMKWKFDAAGDISATPAVVAGQVYVPDWAGMLYRIDATTGTPVWSRSIAAILGDASDAGPVDYEGGTINGSAPGLLANPILASRGTPVVAGNLVVFGIASNQAAYLVAVDKDTGTLVWQTLLDPHPAAIISSSPVVDGGRVYIGVSSSEEGFPYSIPGYTCCSFRGSAVAVDLATGKIVWQTHTIDDSVYFAPDGGTSGYAGGAVWSGTPAIDHKRNQVYITSGNNYAVPAEAGTPIPDGDRIESILALDLDNGAVKWSSRMTSGDVWSLENIGAHDYDFGCGANLFQATIAGVTRDVVGAGQKSGVYWAVDPDTGNVLWKTQVGPGGHLGGIHWGTATDGQRIFVGVNDENGGRYMLGGTGEQAGTATSVGSWAALDPGTGSILWQIANPSMTAPLMSASVNGPVAVVNGVVFAGSMDASGTMYAIDASSGKVLWSFPSGATVYSGPAVVGGSVYWGNGYPPGRLGFGTPGHTLYAFAVSGG
jgi:polyvinyl alcohol dehydrogenase (cytochrome)